MTTTPDHLPRDGPPDREDDPPDREIGAPELRETADIWWDSGTDPRIRWDAAGRRFWLVDGIDASQRLLLVALDGPAQNPLVVAGALRHGLAACDFPPTEDGVPAHRARATLRAAGVGEV